MPTNIPADLEPVKEIIPDEIEKQTRLEREKRRDKSENAHRFIMYSIEGQSNSLKFSLDASLVSLYT